MDKLISRIAYIYIALPFIIFALGFMRWYISIPAVAVAIWGLVCMWKDADSFEIKVKDANDILILVFGFVIVLSWVVLSGIGNVTWQNIDHLWRNALFKILVDYDWPPVNSEGRGLTYYIGFWLPSALIGKLFGLKAGFIFQIVWATIGVYLVYLYICEYFKKISILPLIIFIFFSGLDILGAHIPDLFTHSIREIPPLIHLETWAGNEVFMLSSITTQLFWVFNQCIYAWLVLMVILHSRSNKYVVFIMGLLLINNVFGFIGIVPYIIYRLFTHKKMFSIQNFICGGVTGILTFLFYLGNDAAPSSTNSTSVEDGVNFFLYFFYLYIAFIILEVLVYVVLAFKYNKKNPLIYITAIWLMACPLIRMGVSNDFGMRASIPALMLLSLLVIDALLKSLKESNRILTLLIVITLLIGAVTPVHEFMRTIEYTAGNAEHYFGEESNIFEEKNFSCDADITFFFNRIGR